MKRFSFNLEPILELRRRAEENVKKMLANKNAEIYKTLKEKKELEETLISFLQQEKKNRKEKANLLSLRFFVAYRFQLEKDIIQKEKMLENLNKEKEKILELLSKAKKDVKALEIIRQKKYKQWEKDYKREIQEIIDDVSQKEHIRKKKNL
jgi:flagellar export protein FliJ